MTKTSRKKLRMPQNWLANNFIAFRRRHGINQTQLAALLGTSQGTIVRWETSRFVPDHVPALLLALERMDDVLGSAEDGTVGLSGHWLHGGVEELIARHKRARQANKAAREIIEDAADAADNAETHSMEESTDASTRRGAEASDGDAHRRGAGEE